MAKIDQMAMSKENWERVDKGLPPLPEPVVKMPIAQPPSVPNKINLKEINPDKFVRLVAMRDKIKNKEGVVFIGYEVTIYLEGDKSVSGWMSESDLLELRRQQRGKIASEDILLR